MVSSSSLNATSSGQLYFGGISSGLDTGAIIDALTAVASRPITLAQERVGILENRQKALQTINSSLANLLNTLGPLRNADTFRARRADIANLDDAAKLGVSASSTAAIGSFTVDILGLATSTKLASTTAIGQAVTSNVPLDEAGFGLGPTAGTFTVNSTVFTIPAATFTRLESGGAVGVAVSTSATLATAGLTVPPAGAGSFTINGTSISYDAAVDSLGAVISRINSSSAGVTASFDANTQQLVLTRKDDGPALISVTDDTGNFLQSMNVVDGTNVKVGTETAGTDLISLGDVVDMINNAAIGVTASIANDGDGRPNRLQLSSGSAITLGSGADTSNFLSMTHLLASPGGTTRSSTRNLGTLSTTASLNDARLATALSSSSGEFSINGVTIAYDAATDSVSSMISKINASGANVTASYDAIEDKLRLSSNATGAISIALGDTTGNFLASTGLLAATQALGANASYQINGGATQYSTTNEVSNAVPGVSLTLKQTTSSAITVGVSSDAASVRNRLQSFVAQFNSTMGIITDSTKFAEDGKSGTLIGDTGLQGLGARLRGFVGGVSLGNDSSLNSLASIGVTFGAVGSAPGQTGVLTLDNAKFDAAFASNPEGVIRLLTRFTATGTLDPASFGSLTGVSGAPTSVPDSGKYTLASSTNGSLTVTFTPDNGATPVVQTRTVSPGEVNTTLIPGMTLTFAATLVDGTDTIVVGAAEEGIGKAFHEYLDGMTRAGGVMQGRDSEIATRISDLNKHIERMETRIEAKRQSLIQRYAALEVTMQRLQGQQSALTNFVNQLSGNRRSS